MRESLPLIQREAFSHLAAERLPAGMKMRRPFKQTCRTTGYYAAGPQEGESMLKVLIADDEQLICSMITKMIPWEEAGLIPAGTANNGVEILEKIESEKPDIVITDIRMPGIDGLTMIERAMKISPETEFIIISGYKNFEYAHQALTMGVRYYLLKPIDRTELTDALNRIIRGKTKKAETEAENEVLEEQKATLKRSRREHFLSSVLQETSLETRSTESSGDQDLEFGNERYLAFFIKADWTGDGEIASGILDILQNAAEREEQNWNCEFVSSRVKSGVISVINYPAGAREAHPEDMETLYTKCRREMDKFAGYSLTIGVGKEKEGISGVRDSINEAVYAVKCRIRRGVGRLIFYDQLKYDKELTYKLPVQYRRGISRAVEALDAEAVKGDLQEAEELRTGSRNASPVLVFEMIEEFRKLITEVWQTNGVEKETIAGFSLSAENLMDRCTSVHQLISQFEDLIDLYFRKILAERRESGQAPIRAAKAYLSGHFAENPTLEEVAEAVSMSTSYFSTLFKKETGIGFSEYLIQLRCEEAKRLMRETSDSMSVIAMKVGYQDAKYFSRIFRKTVGIKPSEYRKIYR